MCRQEARAKQVHERKDGFWRRPYDVVAQPSWRHFEEQHEKIGLEMGRCLCREQARVCRRISLLPSLLVSFLHPDRPSCPRIEFGAPCPYRARLFLSITFFHSQTGQSRAAVAPAETVCYWDAVSYVLTAAGERPELVSIYRRPRLDGDDMAYMPRSFWMRSLPPPAAADAVRTQGAATTASGPRDLPAAALSAALDAGRARLGDARRKLAQVPAGVRRMVLERSRSWRTGAEQRGRSGARELVSGRSAATLGGGAASVVVVVVCCCRCGRADHKNERGQSEDQGIDW